jgi:TRAP transporter TAXI family solute receptor
MTRSGGTRTLALFAAAALAVTGGAAGCAKQGTRLSIATGGTTGVYYVYGGGFAKLISANIENTEATASATSASNENISLVAKGQADIAFSQSDSATDAVTGRESFKTRQPIQALARIYDNYTHVVVTEDSGAEKVADLKGKRVSVGPPNSGTQLIALRLLRAAGLNPDTDIRKQPLSINESVQGMKDRTIDAFIWVGGIPTAGVTDLASTRKDVRILDTSDLLPALNQRYPNTYTELSIAPAVYSLRGESVKTVGVPNLLLVSNKMEQDLAYQITRLLFQKKPDLVRVHPEARNLDPSLGQKVAPVTLHPGAQRYFRESGSAR